MLDRLPRLLVLTDTAAGLVAIFHVPLGGTFTAAEYLGAFRFHPSRLAMRSFFLGLKQVISIDGKVLGIYRLYEIMANTIS